MGWRTPLAWLVFMACIISSAALLSSRHTGPRMVGTALALLLALALAGLALVHYYSQRRAAQR